MSLDLFKNFRYNLQLLRVSKQISGKELSEKLGMSSIRINNLEGTKHHPTVEELIKIAKYFEVSADDMFHKKATINL